MYGNRNNLVTENHMKPPKAMLLPQVILKITIWKLQIQFNISYVILRLLVGHSYVSRLFSFATSM